MQELRSLCFDLNIEFEILAGNSLEEKAMELISYCSRRGRLSELIAHCHELRPHITWPIEEDTSSRPINPSPSTPSVERVLMKPITEIQPKSRFPNIEIPDPLGEEVLVFAREIESQGTRLDDPNATKWAKVSGPRRYHEWIEGYWSGRWRTRKSGWYEGTALINIVDSWAYIHYEDETNKYVIQAHIDKQKDMLVGRYMNINIKSDSMPWVALIVDKRRIDGYWPKGRWDLRR
jgi:hypothetical protein